MGNHISSNILTETLTLSLCTDGYWLYDKTRSMNLSMRAKTPQDAFVECIKYYQNRLLKLEKEYSELSAKVNSFVSQFVESEDNEFP